MRQWNLNWIVLTAICVHAAWGLMLLFSAQPLLTTPMADTPFRHNQYSGAIVYLAAAAIAAIPLTSRRIDRTFLGFACCLPQQFLLMLSAGTAMRCVVRGAYADGVPRPWQFILADQMLVIIGMTFHTASLIDYYYFSRMRQNGS